MKSTTVNAALKEVRELFNEVRSNLSREERKGITKKNSTKKNLFIIF